MSKPGKIVLTLAGGALLLHLLGITPEALIAATQADAAQLKEDSAALLSGEYQDRIARQYQAEAARLREQAPVRDELQRELAQARQDMLDARAAALAQQSNALLRGDLDSLKRQVTENARNAGGQP